MQEITCLWEVSGTVLRPRGDAGFGPSRNPNNFLENIKHHHFTADNLKTIRRPSPNTRGYRGLLTDCIFARPVTQLIYLFIVSKPPWQPQAPLSPGSSTEQARSAFLSLPNAIQQLEGRSSRPHRVSRQFPGAGHHRWPPGAATPRLRAAAGRLLQPRRCQALTPSRLIAANARVTAELAAAARLIPHVPPPPHPPGWSSQPAWPGTPRLKPAPHATKAHFSRHRYCAWSCVRVCVSVPLLPFKPL